MSQKHKPTAVDHFEVWALREVGLLDETSDDPPPKRRRSITLPAPRLIAIQVDLFLKGAPQWQREITRAYFVKCYAITGPIEGPTEWMPIRELAPTTMRKLFKIVFAYARKHGLKGGRL